MIKALFFDVDNTLYDWASRRFISSGIKAIKKAKENGVKVFLCSARPYASMKEFGVFDLGIRFDGYIASCGSVAVLKNRTLQKNTMRKSDVKKLCRIAIENSLTMEIVTPRTRFLIAPGNTFLANYHGTYSDTVPPVHSYHDEDVTGVLLFAPTEYDAVFQNAMPHLTYYRFHECGVDIMDKEHRKGEGIQSILDALHIKKEEALSFGDDIQDITMADSTVFICVGNGKEEVKAAADFVCPPIAEDGIEQALKQFRVI